MFPSPMFDPFLTENDNDQITQQAKAVRSAHLRYLDARRKSWWLQKLARLTGRPNRLKQLSQVHHHNGIVNFHHLGIQSVKIDCIVGSENRADDFDDRFLPVKDHNRERWIKIAELMLLNVTLPAVELIKVNNTFYVRDGHHRISVARHFGQKHIDANIIEMLTEPLDFKPQLAPAEEPMVMKAQVCPS